MYIVLSIILIEGNTNETEQSVLNNRKINDNI